MDDLDISLNELGEDMSPSDTSQKSDGGSNNGLKAGIAIAVILALVGIAIAVVSLIQLKNAETAINTNTASISTNTADIKTLKNDFETVKPVAGLYDPSSETLTVKNVNLETINFTYGGKDGKSNGMGITAIPGNIEFVADVVGKGPRVIAIIKYQDKVNPGGFYAAGDFSPRLKPLAEHTCKPQTFC